MRKRNNFKLLFNINIRLAFNKKSITTIILSFIILVLYLMFILYNSYEPNEYLNAYDDVHKLYIKEGLFVINVVNFLLIMVLLTTLFVNTDSYDSMYVSYINRSVIARSKISSIIYLEFIISIIEYLLLIIPAIIIFPYYKIDISNVYILIYIIIYGMIQIGISLLLLAFVNNNFVPMIGFIISFMLLILSSEFSEKVEYVEYFLPTNFMKFNIPTVSLVFIIFSIIFYRLKFNAKNIN